MYLKPKQEYVFLSGMDLFLARTRKPLLSSVLHFLPFLLYSYPMVEKVHADRQTMSSGGGEREREMERANLENGDLLLSDVGQLPRDVLQ